MNTAIFTAWVLSMLVQLGATEHVTPAPELAPAIAEAALKRPLEGSAPRMAALLVAVAWRESRFDVAAKGDGGQSLGAWQISRAWVRDAPGLDAEARLATKLVVESFRICASRPLAERLSWYAWGRAGCDHAHAASRARMSLAARLLREHPAPQN